MKTLAVIEDNADNRLILQAMLRRHFRILAYASGPEGLAGLRQERPDVLLLDISLPGMDGLEVLQAIRADADLRQLPVIAFTAHAMTGDRERYIAAGFDDYLTKPVMDDQVLVDTIRRWLPA
jgi:CheY-like chemotaxis protein